MIRPALACAALLLAASPAFAESGLCRTGITAEEAIRIARTQGVERVREVDCDDGKWEVEGQDAQGRSIEVEIHAGTGRVLDIDRD